jgi:hypothetical protein
MLQSYRQPHRPHGKQAGNTLLSHCSGNTA